MATQKTMTKKKKTMPSSKAAAAAAPPAAPSTKFEYWDRINPGAALVYPSPPAPAPVVTAAATAAASTAVTAAGTSPGVPAPSPAPVPAPSSQDFVKTYFKEITVSPFGSLGTLPSDREVRKVDVICAALSAGYGKQLVLSSALVLKTSPASKAHRHYLGQRLEMLLACLDYSGTIVTPKPFFAFIEPSEKVALSFIAGCLGAHIAARQWVAAAGRHMTQFLHSGIYTRSTAVLPSALMHMVKAIPNGKTPDFLVEDDQHAWHVFESKGGAADNRWGQIIGGLKQLENVTGLGMAAAGTSPPPPTSRVCVQTLLNKDKALSITLVSLPVPPAGTAKAPSPPITIALVPGVARLFVALEALDWFQALQQDSGGNNNGTATAMETQDPDWAFKRTTAFRGLIVGAPKELLRKEATLRAHMAWYLAVQETLEFFSNDIGVEEQQRNGVPLPSSQEAFVKKLTGIVSALPFFEDDTKEGTTDGTIPPFTPASAYTAIQRALRENPNAGRGALHAWSACLGLPALAAEVDAIWERSRVLDLVSSRLPNSPYEHVLTEGGLYLRVAPEAQA